MPDALMLLAALALSVVGMGWLALSMEVHWRQARGQVAPPRAFLLRALGAVALLLSLALCLAVDAASMAVLVWIMALAASALAVAFTLTWRASALAPLVFWTGRG